MLHPVYVFDAYGTLFDVHSAVARHRDAVGDLADRLSEIWRTKQLEYSWVRSLAGAYRDFWSCTEDALDFAAAATDGIESGLRAALLSAYRRLDAYSDVIPMLSALKAGGAQTATLSNGSPDMLASAVNSAGIETLLDAVLSVDAAGVFKPDPRSYALVEGRFGCSRQDVSFQSSNRWDVAGAVRFGFRAVWINRTGQPDEYRDLPADIVLPDLSRLGEQATRTGRQKE